jgi:hypothetical protein
VDALGGKSAPVEPVAAPIAVLSLCEVLRNPVS